MNYSETLTVINHLKSLNLKTISNSEIKDLLRPIISIPLPVVFLEKGNRIIRCRTLSINEVPAKIYNTYAEFSNPKKKKFFGIGRANSEETTVLYGSIETEILNGGVGLGSVKSRQLKVDVVRYENCFPIPLNEDWLVNFGFVEEDDEWCKGYVRVGSTDDDGFYFSGLSDGIVDLSYVHQLQNLAYVINGEDLILNG